MVNAPIASESAEVLAPLGYLGLLLIQSLQDGVRRGSLRVDVRRYEIMIHVYIIQLSPHCHS